MRVIFFLLSDSLQGPVRDNVVIQIIAGYGESRHIVFKYGQFAAIIGVNNTFFILGNI